MVFKRKITSSVIALSMIFSAASALIFTETASAAIPTGVTWNQIYFQDFENGGAKPEFTKSGTSSAWASDSCYGDDFTNANLYDLGDHTLMLKQRKNITTKATMRTDPEHADTPINGKVPASKLNKVKISFNIAKNYEDGTATRISIVGDDSNEAKQEQNNILVIKRYNLYYTANGYNAANWSNSTWHKVDIYVDCVNDVYDVVYDGTKILENIALDYDYTSIYGVNFNADKGSSSNDKDNYYTYLDNISFSVIADTYSVTLNTNGGTINSGNITSYTETVGATLPTNVTRADYTFAGWYAESDCSGSAVASISSSATGNKVFYAKWIPNGTWDKVFSQDFEPGSNYDTYFTENLSNMASTDGTGTYTVQGYTNNTGDDLGSRVKRIAGTKSDSRTLVLNEASSPLYTGNEYNGKADIVRISLDLAQNTTDAKDFHIRLVGSVAGDTVTTGMDYGKNRFLFAKSGRLYAQDQDSDDAHNLHSFSQSKWHRIVVEINCMTDTYDVYVYDGSEYDGRYASDYSLPYDFDKIYGISITANSGGNAGVVQQVFVDNIRYYVPGSAVTISSASFSSGTVSATVATDAAAGYGNKVILAAYGSAGETDLVGVALTDALSNTNSYNLSITGLSSAPHHIKAFAWDMSEIRASAKWTEYILP